MIAGSFGLVLMIPTAVPELTSVLTVVVAIIWVISFFFLWPVEYVVMGEALMIRFGLVTREIPYASIACIRPPSKDIKIQMRTVKAAYSLDRLIIEANMDGKDWIFTASPREKAEFLKDIQQRYPAFQADNGGLQKRA
jgi:hypothetical protein